MSRVEIKFTPKHDEDRSSAGINRAQLTNLTNGYAQIIRGLPDNNLRVRVKNIDDSQVLIIEGQGHTLNHIIPLLMSCFAGDDDILSMNEQSDQSKLALAFAFYEIMINDE